jgi:hypothetical protein
VRELNGLCAIFITYQLTFEWVFLSVLYPRVCSLCCWPCLQGKDIVFRFIIEYSSLRDFGPLGNNIRSIFILGFLKDDILACDLRLVIDLWYLEGFWFLWEDLFFEAYIFAWWNIFIFIILLLPLDTF